MHSANGRHAWCDAGGTSTIAHRGMDDLVLEQGVAPLRHAREEARVGVETGVEERRARGEGLREAGFRRGVGRLYTRRRKPPEPRMTGAE
jgi:hypothetical protein